MSLMLKRDRLTVTTMRHRKTTLPMHTNIFLFFSFNHTLRHGHTETNTTNFPWYRPYPEKILHVV